jgi:hypothetical protein
VEAVVELGEGDGVGGGVDDVVEVLDEVDGDGVAAGGGAVDVEGLLAEDGGGSDGFEVAADVADVVLDLLFDVFVHGFLGSESDELGAIVE